MSKLAIHIKILLLFVLSEMWFCYVGQTGLELSSFLPQCCIYRLGHHTHFSL